MKDNNFFSKGLEMQKTMFDMWAKPFEDIIDKEEDSTHKNPFEDMLKQSEKNYKEFLETCMKNFGMLGSFPEKTTFNFTDQQELFKKFYLSASVYQDMFSFWKEMMENMPYDTPKKSINFYKNFNDNYMNIVKKCFIPMFPESMQLVSNQTVELMQDYSKMGLNFLKPWIEDSDELKDVLKKAMEGDKDSYLEFFRVVSENYEKSFGKVFNTASLGLYKENIEEQMEGYDSFIKYMNSFNEMFSLIYKVSVENMENLIKKYQDMYKDDKMPKTFREFYELWWSTNENEFIKLFGTEEFSKIYGQFSERLCDFKIKFDKILEVQLKQLPIPTRADMNSLYKTVYEQKKEIRSLKKSMKEITKRLEELENKSNRK